MYSLYYNDDGLRLMKEYNQLIKQKQYLEELTYQHKIFDDSKYANTKQRVYELINEVENA